MKAFLSRILNWMMVIILIPSMVGCDADLFGQNKIVAISLTSDTTVIDVDDADTAYITLTASARTKGGKTVTLTPSWEYDEEVFEAIGTPTSTLRLKLNMDGTGPNGKDITGFSTIKAKDSGNPSVFDELVVNVTGDLQSIWFQDADGNRISTVTLNQKETITYDIATYPRAAQGFELIGEADADHLEVATINVDSLAKQATVTTGFPGTATLKVSTADGRFSTKLDVVVSELEIPDTTASRILIDQGSYLSLAPSEEERILTASAYDQYNQKIEGAVIDWSSSAPEIVSVVRDGARARIKANDVGKATITAFLADDPSLTATMLIEVGTSIQDIIITPYSPESARARSFSIVEEEDAQMSSSYPIGKNAYYKASYLPASTEDVGVIWSIDDSSVAEIVSVDEEIVEIETKGTGSANLIATSSINPEIASYVTISVFDQDVTPDYSISHISLDKVAIEMEQGSSEYIKATAVFQDGSEGITDIVWGTDGNAAEISYTSPDTSEIEITAATPGLTTVSATALSNPFLESSATILVYPVGQQPGTELRKIVPSPASLTLIEGRSAKVDISYLPPDAEVGILTPVVSSDIIRISDYDDESVTVEGVSKGEAYVTLTSSKDSTVTGRISVKVLSEEEALKPSRIRLSENVLELRKGDHQEINAEVILSDGSIGNGIYDIDWEITSGDGIVGINADGTRLTVTGDEEGEATITASLADNPEITSGIDVIVYSSSAVLGTELRKIIPSQESITLVEGDSTEIKVSYLPEDTDEIGITWSVGDGGIVSADGNAEAVTIKALKKGNTTVTATSSIRPSIKAEISVTVLSVEEAYKPVSVEISENMLDLEKGSSGQLSASVNLSNGVSSTDYEFIWTVIEGDGIVELTPTGKDVLVKAVNKGEAVVSVTISGYEELSARAVVTVYDVGEIVGTKLRKIVPDQTSVLMTIGDESEIGISYLPAGTDEKGVTWSVADGGVVSAEGDDESVRITALSKGRATVRATSTVEPSIYFDITVTVQSEEEAAERNPASVRLSKNITEIRKGGYDEVEATVYLTDGSTSLEHGIKWSVERGEGVVEITPSGNVLTIRAVSTGEATISASVEGHEDVSARMEVLVYETGASGEIPVKSIIPSKDSLTMLVGESEVITLSYLPLNTDEKGVVWTLSGSGVVTLSGESEDGVTVEALKTGSATVTAVSTVNSSVRAKININVISDEQSLNPPASIRLSRNTYELEVGETGSITGEVVLTSGSISAEHGITWSIISGNDVIEITDSGNEIILKALQKGEAVVSATISEYEDVSATAMITVYDVGEIVGTKLRKIVPDQTSVLMTIGDESEIGISYLPAGTDEKGVTWSVADGGVVSAEGDDESVRITALSKGRATVRATSTVEPSIYSDITVTVQSEEEAAERNPASVRLSKNITEIRKGGYDEVEATVYLTDGSTSLEHGIKWSVERGGEGVVEITPSGNALTIRAVSTGEATISASVEGHEDVSARMEVLVYETGASSEIPVKSIIPSKDSVTMLVGESEDITLSYLPLNTDEKGVVWTLSGSGVVTLSGESEDGVTVDALKTGTATVTAVSTVNSSVRAKININVISEEDLIPSSIRLSRNALEIETGKTSYVTADVMLSSGEASSEFELEWMIDEGDDVVDITPEAGRLAVHANKEGSASISVSVKDHSSIRAKLEVLTYDAGGILGTELSKIVPSQQSISIAEGDTVEVGISYLPSTTAEKGLTWTISDGRIAYIDGNDESVSIEAIESGNTTVTATSTVRPEISASISVNVYSEEDRHVPSSISVYPSVLSLAPEDSETVIARAYNTIGEELQDVELSWQVIEGNGHITLDSNAQEATITALSEGLSTVRVQVVGSNVYADVEIIVEDDLSDPTVQLESIVLSTGSLTIIEGFDAEVKASYIPQNTWQKGLTWSSSSDAVKVEGTDDGAVITGLTPTIGTAYVTATSSINPEISARVNVRVVEEAEAVRLISRVELTPSSMEIETPYPLNEIQIQAQSYDSSNNILTDSYSWLVEQTSDVVSIRSGVNGSAWITVNGPGKATVKATSSLNSSISASMVISVGGALENITITPSSVQVYRNGKATLRASLIPADTLEDELVWQVISNDGIERIRLSQGSLDSMTATITGIESGETQVKVYSRKHPDISAICDVKVLAQALPDDTMPETISLSPTTVTIEPPFETEIVNATVYGDNGTIYPIGVDWLIENGLTVEGDEPIASLSPTGDFGVRITPERAGEATLTAVSKVDETITASIPLIIEGEIGEIEFIGLDQQLLSVVVGDVAQVQVELSAADGSQTVETDIEWYQDGFVPVYDDSGKISGYDTNDDGKVDDDGSGMAFTLSPTQSGGIYGCSVSADTVGTYTLVVRSRIRPEILARLTVNITPAAQITGAVSISPSSLSLSPDSGRTLVTATIETESDFSFPEDTEIIMETEPSGLLVFSSPLWNQDGTTFTQYASPGLEPGDGYISVYLPDYPGIKKARGRVSIGGALESFEPYNPEGEDDILIVSKGDTIAIGVNYVPSNTTEKGVIWTSADPDIVSVVSSDASNRAVLSASGVGTTTITAESTAHPGIEGIRYVFTVTVTPVVEAVSFTSVNSSGGTTKGLTFNIVSGESLNLDCEIFPEILNDTTQLLITPHEGISGNDDDAPTLKLQNGTLNDYVFTPAEGVLGSYQYDIMQQGNSGLRGEVIDVLTINVTAESTSLGIADTSGAEIISTGDYEYVFSNSNQQTEFTAYVMDDQFRPLSNVEWVSSNPQIARVKENDDNTVTVEMRYPGNWNKCAGECTISASIGNGGAIVNYKIKVYVGLEIPETLYQALSMLSPFKDDPVFVNHHVLLPSLAESVTSLNFSNLRIADNAPIEIYDGSTYYLSADYFPNLKYLNLSNCILSSTTLSLRNSAPLETLIIDQPSTSASFQLDSISNVPTSLKEVSLDYNLLSSVSTFNGLGSLKTLSAEYNQLTSFRDSSMQNSIEEIYLSGNSLLESVRLSKPNLKTVEANNCAVLDTLEVTSTGLEKLSAYSCSLTDVEVSESCVALEYLDLHDNKLGNSKNKIRIKDAEITQKANLGGQDWDYDSSYTKDWSSEWPSGMNYLNLSGNNIVYYRYKGDACNGQIFFTVRIGSDAGIVAKFTISGSGPGGTLYYRKKGSSSWIKVGSSSGTTITATKMGAAFGDIYEFRMDADSNGWTGEPDRYLYVYPYGQ